MLSEQERGQIKQRSTNEVTETFQEARERRREALACCDCDFLAGWSGFALTRLGWLLITLNEFLNRLANQVRPLAVDVWPLAYTLQSAYVVFVEPN